MDEQLEKLVEEGLALYRAKAQAEQERLEQKALEEKRKADATWELLEQAAKRFLPEVFHPYLEFRRIVNDIERLPYIHGELVYILVPDWMPIIAVIEGSGGSWTGIKEILCNQAPIISHYHDFWYDVKEGDGVGPEDGPSFLKQGREAEFTPDEWSKVCAFAKTHGAERKGLKAQVLEKNAEAWTKWEQRKEEQETKRLERDAQKKEKGEKTKPIPTDLSPYQRLKIARDVLTTLHSAEDEDTYLRLGTPMALEAIAQILLAATTEDGRIRLSQVTDEF